MTYTISEIEKLLEETTKGEWMLYSDIMKKEWYVMLETDVGCYNMKMPDARFIAASKNIVKQLLKERAAYRQVAINHFDCGEHGYLSDKEIEDCIEDSFQRFIKGLR